MEDTAIGGRVLFLHASFPVKRVTTVPVTARRPQHIYTVAVCYYQGLVRETDTPPYEPHNIGPTAHQRVVLSSVYETASSGTPSSAEVVVDKAGACVKTQSHSKAA